MGHELWMQRALDLAQRGLGQVSPNPMVGCVIVRGGRVIGEGWHRQFGGPHAEVEAVRAVADQRQIAGADVYVTLEPCSHYGKTPPCADLLVQLRPAQVFVSNLDPNPKVSGRGIARLREAGIRVSTGLLHEQGQQLNRRFFTHITQRRPYLILKWAQSQDGLIARADGSSKWISGTLSRKLVHRWRTEEDAIMVGTGTALTDNPQLTARSWPGRSPLRILLDRQGRVPADAHLLNGSTPTLCFRQTPLPGKPPLRVLPWPASLQELLTALYRENIGSLIVEGGSQLLQSFVAAQLWDEARIFTAPVYFGEGFPAPKLKGQPIWHTQVGQDQLTLLHPSA